MIKLENEWITAYDGKLTFCGVLAKYYDKIAVKYKLSSGTQKNYAKDYENHILPHLQDLPLEEYDGEDFEEAIAKINSNGHFAKSTIQRYRRLIKRVIEAAVEYEGMRNPLWGDEFKELLTTRDVEEKEDLALPRSMPLAMQVRLVEKIRKDALTSGEARGLMICMDTGSRLKEAAAVSVADHRLPFRDLNCSELALHNSTVGQSSDRHAKMKTANAYRIVVLGPDASTILNARVAEIQDMIASGKISLDENSSIPSIEEIPLVSKDDNHLLPCSSPMLTKAFKRLLQEVGYDEKDVVAATRLVESEEFQNAVKELTPAELGFTNEKDMTAYALVDFGDLLPQSAFNHLLVSQEQMGVGDTKHIFGGTVVEGGKGGIDSLVREDLLEIPVGVILGEDVLNILHFLAVLQIAFQTVVGNLEIGAVVIGSLSGLQESCIHHGPLEDILDKGDTGFADLADTVFVQVVLACAAAVAVGNLHGTFAIGFHLGQGQVQGASAVVDQQQVTVEGLMCFGFVVVGDEGTGGLGLRDHTDIAHFDIVFRRNILEQDVPENAAAVLGGQIFGPELGHTDDDVLKFFVVGLIGGELLFMGCKTPQGVAQEFCGDGAGGVSSCVAMFLQNFVVGFHQQHFEGAEQLHTPLACHALGAGATGVLAHQIVIGNLGGDTGRVALLHGHGNGAGGGVVFGNRGIGTSKVNADIHILDTSLSLIGPTADKAARRPDPGSPWGDRWPA